MGLDPSRGSASGVAGTRARILTTSIRLFSDAGYDLVSMRDVAAALGIRASSIYNHFRNKAAILWAILELFRRELRVRRINEWHEDLHERIRRQGGRAVIVEAMLAPLRLLEDPLVRRIIRIVARAQFHDEAVRTFLLQEMIRKPHGFLTQVVRAAGVAEGCAYDPAFVAAELQSPMTAYFYELSLEPHRVPPDAAAIGAAVERHVSFVLACAGGADTDNEEGP
jgi:AcrR family transcriptional regulator